MRAFPSCLFVNRAPVLPRRVRVGWRHGRGHRHRREVRGARDLQGCNSIDIFLGPVSGLEPCQSYFGVLRHILTYIYSALVQMCLPIVTLFGPGQSVNCGQAAL